MAIKISISVDEQTTVFVGDFKDIHKTSEDITNFNGFDKTIFDGDDVTELSVDVVMTFEDDDVTTVEITPKGSRRTLEVDLITSKGVKIDAHTSNGSTVFTGST